MANLTSIHPKVSGMALGAALTTIIIAELTRHGIQIAADEGAAVATIIGSLVGYLVPADASGPGNSGDTPPPPAPVPPTPPVQP